MDTTVPVRDVVLVGGGHAHALVIRRFAMQPLPGVRMTLISRDPLTPYSGMLPGLVAGHYTHADTHIDLVRVCRRAGVRFIVGDVCGIDRHNKTVQLHGRPDIGYDVLSLDTGSAPDTSTVVGAAQFTTPVKPVSRFYQRWQALLDRLDAGDTPLPVSVVGSGAGGFELLMAMQHQLSTRSGAMPTLHWIVRGEAPLGEYPPCVRRQAMHLASRAGIQVHTDFDVAEVRDAELISRDGRTLQAGEILWCTGAKGPDWLKDSELELTGNGFLAVNASLQSLSDSAIFAAGDVATQVDHPRPKAGVFAVRAGPYLAENLERQLLGKPLKAFRPQREFLSILATGPRHAIAAKGRFAISGRWVWRWKNRIDRQFMARFDPDALPQSMAAKQTKTIDPALLADAPREKNGYRCAGCGAKVAADVLQEVLNSLPNHQSGAAEDAVLLELPGTQLVQTVDQLRAICDDPWLFARIATQHALSDLHASQARPHSAMAMITLPYASETLQARDLQQLMRGLLEILDENHCRLIGGHTSEMPALSVGLSINGLPGPRHYDKSGLRPGDKLILTKALGTGVLMAGDMRAATPGPALYAAFDAMQQGNADASRVLALGGATAMTDVTGFGLLGHLGELLDAAGVSARIDPASLPLLDGAEDLFNAGMQSSLQAMNARFGHHLQVQADALSPRLTGCLFDPQTSGGLLAGVAPAHARKCLSALHDAGYTRAAIIGEVLANDGGSPSVQLGA